jgi:hypothetical protein
MANVTQTFLLYFLLSIVLYLVTAWVSPLHRALRSLTHSIVLHGVRASPANLI